MYTPIMISLTQPKKQKNDVWNLKSDSPTNVTKPIIQHFICLADCQESSRLSIQSAYTWLIIPGPFNLARRIARLGCLQVAPVFTGEMKLVETGRGLGGATPTFPLSTSEWPPANFCKSVSKQPLTSRSANCKSQNRIPIKMICAYKVESYSCGSRKNNLSLSCMSAICPMT